MTTQVSSGETPVSELVDIGRLLQQGRLEKGFTKENVAEELHLHVRQINALESGDFSCLKSPAFIKGYLRSCAKLYGMNGDSLVDLYTLLQPPQQKAYIPAATIGPQKIVLASKRSNKTTLILLLTIVLIVGVACSLWFGFRDLPIVLPEKVEVPIEPVAVISATPSEISSALVPTDLPVVPSYENQSIMTPSQEIQDSILHVEFVDDCWVQLKAGDGKVLHDKTYKKGEILDMPVKTPLHVWFGRASAVNVSYNGAVVEVPIKSGFQSAQFVLGDESPSPETE